MLGSPCLSPDIERTFDAAAVNQILNHADVRPWLGLAGGGDLDISPLVRDRGNYIFGVRDRTSREMLGVFLLLDHLDGTLDWHSAFLPLARGRFAVEAARRAQQWVFANTSFQRLVTIVPLRNRAAAIAAHAAGFVEVGKVDGEPLLREPGIVSIREIKRPEAGRCP
jgi:hypothetical protein